MRPVLLLRVAATVLLMALLWRWLPRDAFSDAQLTSASTATAWLVAAALLLALALAMSALRWWEAANTLGLWVSKRRVLWATLAGQFVSNFLPSTIGGDVLRVNRLGRAVGDRHGAFASVIIERLTGWTVLPTLMAIGLVLMPSQLGRVEGVALAVIGAGVAAVLGVILFLAEHPKGLGRITRGTVVRDALGAVHDGLVAYRKNFAAALALFSLGLVFALLQVAAVACVGAAFGVRLSPFVWLAVVPAVLAAQVLPVTIGGLGVREAALVFFLGPHGVAEGEALVIGLLLYGLTLLVSLAGAPALAVADRGREHEPGDQAEASERERPLV